MFGDMGHGSLWLLITCYIFMNRKKLTNAGLGVAVEYRYLLLMMAIFAIYCGSLYNEFFSLPFALFGTCYTNDLSVSGESRIVTRIDGCTVIYGMDPKWFIASNDLVFMNSFKMKWAVIFGVTQMVSGIFLHAINCIYFKDWLSFVFEFIPQVIYFVGLFG